MIPEIILRDRDTRIGTPPYGFEVTFRLSSFSSTTKESTLDISRTTSHIRRTINEMATDIMTAEERVFKPRKDANLPPENERHIRCCSDIASFLIQEHEASQDPSKPRKDVNLNSLRSKMAKKHRLSNIPPLTAIIAAIPEHYKKYIMPKLLAKPISKSCLISCCANANWNRKCFWNCCGCGYVQTA